MVTESLTSFFNVILFVFGLITLLFVFVGILRDIFWAMVGQRDERD